jgi:NAD(P)-dependent dehydrogenase (short-subunit alcohol dehydrogenase family)
MTKAVWPHMAAQGHGRIINTTSNAGFAGNEQLVHYGAAKLGVAGFTKALAQEAANTGITVNAIAPMAITRMNRDAFFGGADAGGQDWQADIRGGMVPMGPPSIVAPTVLWLAHHSTAINGEIRSTASGKVARVYRHNLGRRSTRICPRRWPPCGVGRRRPHSRTFRLSPLSRTEELMMIPPLFA